jgi:hypothetical protein
MGRHLRYSSGRPGRDVMRGWGAAVGESAGGNSYDRVSLVARSRSNFRILHEQPAALHAGAWAPHASRSGSGRDGLVLVGNLFDDTPESAGRSWNWSRRVAGQRHGGAISRAIPYAPEASGAGRACPDT